MSNVTKFRRPPGPMRIEHFGSIRESPDGRLVFEHFVAVGGTEGVEISLLRAVIERLQDELESALRRGSAHE